MSGRESPLPLTAALCLLGSTLLWASNAVVGHVLSASISPMTLNLLRWIGALFILIPLAPAVLRRDSPLWPHGPRYALLGLLGIGCYNSLQYWALKTSSPLNVTLVGSSVPLWMLVVGRLFFGSRIRRVDLLGVALSMAGVLWVITRGQPLGIARIEWVQGDVLMLLAALVWAFYSWLLARTQEPTAIRAYWAAFLLAQVAPGVLWSGAFAGAEWALMPDARLHSSPLLWGLIAYVALGPAVLAYRFWGLGVQRSSATVAGFFINFTPVFAAVMSSVMLAEQPKLYHAVAFVLIVSGVWVSSRR